MLNISKLKQKTSVPYTAESPQEQSFANIQSSQQQQQQNQKGTKVFEQFLQSLQNKTFNNNEIKNNFLQFINFFVNYIQDSKQQFQTLTQKISLLEKKNSQQNQLISDQQQVNNPSNLSNVYKNDTQQQHRYSLDPKLTNQQQQIKKQKIIIQNNKIVNSETSLKKNNQNNKKLKNQNNASSIDPQKKDIKKINYDQNLDSSHVLQKTECTSQDFIEINDTKIIKQRNDSFDFINISEKKQKNEFDSINNLELKKKKKLSQLQDLLTQKDVKQQILTLENLPKNEEDVPSSFINSYEINQTPNVKSSYKSINALKIQQNKYQWSDNQNLKSANTVLYYKSNNKEKQQSNCPNSNRWERLEAENSDSSFVQYEINNDTGIQNYQFEKQIIQKEMNRYYKNQNDNLHHKADIGILGEQKFIISADWWRQWVKYVNFDFNKSIATQNKDNKENTMKDGCELKQYQRPQGIYNKNLIKNKIQHNNSLYYELKDNLLEHFDYEAIPNSIFQLLKTWYGVDFQITRLLKIDKSKENQFVLDLYPEKQCSSVSQKELRRPKPKPKDTTSLINQEVRSMSQNQNKSNILNNGNQEKKLNGCTIF